MAFGNQAINVIEKGNLRPLTRAINGHGQEIGIYRHLIGDILNGRLDVIYAT